MNKRKKTVDTTFLSLNQAEERGFIHRDYLAHCLRWSHALRHVLQLKKVGILDVGCGKELPFAGLLHTNKLNSHVLNYVGVDYGPINPKQTKFNMILHEKTDFATMAFEGWFNLVISFEVLEHVEPMHGYQILMNIRHHVTESGVVLISTPCYDAHIGAADNHVNEMTFNAVKLLVQLAGFQIEAVYGTFASQKDYKPHLTAGEQEVFDKLHCYYDSNVLSCFMAPLHPEQARNCLWVLKPAMPVSDQMLLEKVLSIGTKSSSSGLWLTDLKQILDNFTGATCK